ncbi:pectin lyase fold/virulence factor [Mycena sp. CBHHK59/15]|nr:pectin lyase fold/virulence factor [Mycena sp. CBHHK59/15]
MLTPVSASAAQQLAHPTPTCTISPLGTGLDDTDQVLAAIAKCGHGGHTVLQGGVYNITRKMTWDLADAKVDLHGYLSFVPDIEYWLDANNTYRVVFIQSQASWFVITGRDFEVDAHNTGGIQGNGQPWWEYFTTHTREDGDGRPISLTLFRAVRGTIRNFAIQAQPFWCNCVAESRSVVYDGMLCNASNTDPAFAGMNIVPNTDGIDTYRSDDVSMLRWDITCGDDCLAIKGVSQISSLNPWDECRNSYFQNSTNVLARNITCRGGNGIAFGSLAQYANLTDIVENVFMEDLRVTENEWGLSRWNSLPARCCVSIQPCSRTCRAGQVYFKSWDGSINGVPPTGGGGSTGFARNITARNVLLDRVNTPTSISQTNGGKSGDLPATFKFEDLRFENWTGVTATNKIVSFACSAAVNCTNISFSGFNVAGPAGEAPQFICQNVQNLSGLNAFKLDVEFEFGVYYASNSCSTPSTHIYGRMAGRLVFFNHPFLLLCLMTMSGGFKIALTPDEFESRRITLF